jgi:uncharacterized membrane protein
MFSDLLSILIHVLQGQLLAVGWAALQQVVVLLLLWMVVVLVVQVLVRRTAEAAATVSTVPAPVMPTAFWRSPPGSWCCWVCQQ